MEENEISQNELIFMTAFLAAQEDQEKEEIRKNQERQLSAFSQCDKPGTSLEAEPEKNCTRGKRGRFCKRANERVGQNKLEVSSFICS